MKKFLIYIIGLTTFLSCATQVYPVSDSAAFQNQLKSEFENPETTPLKEDEVKDFHGVHFFPVNGNYIVNADFTKIENGKTLPFPTSAKKTKYYKEYGKLNFKLNRKKLELTVYQSEPPIEGYENSLFVPFTDNTNGETSYGGGRYLDLEIADVQNDKVVLDFNKAYNPYCAYSKYYNCPIPPANNYLDTEIKAGVSYP